MGVVFHNPKLSPVRKTVEVDGRKCLVGCRPRAFASTWCNMEAPLVLAINDTIGLVVCLLQVFLSEGDRQRKMGECREEVEANCRGGARSVTRIGLRRDKQRLTGLRQGTNVAAFCVLGAREVPTRGLSWPLCFVALLHLSSPPLNSVHLCHWMW